MFRVSMAKKEAAALADCEIEAVKAYIDAYGSSRRDVESLGLEVTSIVTNKVKYPGGKISVLISVLARKPWECETYAFSLQVAGRRVLRTDSRH
jgi:hypothetical protein